MSTSVNTILSNLRKGLIDSKIGGLHGSILLIPPFVINSSIGIDAAKIIDQHGWRDFYVSLFKGATAFSILPPLEDIERRINDQQRRGLVPLVIGCYDYEAVKINYLKDFIQRYSKDSKIKIELPKEAYEKKQSLFCAAFLKNDFHYFHPQTPFHFGLDVKFILSENLILSNVEQFSQASIQVNFEDGNGFKSVQKEEVVNVSYPKEGTKKILIKVTMGGDVRNYDFLFKVVDDSTPVPDETLSLKSPFAFQGTTAIGHAWVFYGSDNGVKHQSIVNPMIFSEGFPGNYTLAYLWWSLNTNSYNLIDNCLSTGKDVIILGYQDGTIYLEANAGVVIDCIQQVISQRQGSAPLLVGGACMGGVVTRHALAYMEYEGLDHQTALFFSVDSPHFGINVPASIQYLITCFADFPIPLIQAAYSKLTSSAGKELMLFTTSSVEDAPNVPDALRTSFLENSGKVNVFPTKPVKIGSSNGVNTGVCNGTPPSANVVYADLLYLYAAPGDSATDYQNLMFSGGDLLNGYWEGCPADFDSAPGSIESFFNTLASGLNATAYYDDCSFVPTISSLAMYDLNPYNNSDLCRDLVTNPSSSNLDYTYSDLTNNPHMHVSAALVQWYISQFTQY